MPMPLSSIVIRISYDEDKDNIKIIFPPYKLNFIAFVNKLIIIYFNRFRSVIKISGISDSVIIEKIISLTSIYLWRSYLISVKKSVVENSVINS